MEPSSDSTGTADREQDETEQKYYQHQAEEKRQKEQMTNPEVAEISAAEQRHHGDTVLSQKGALRSVIHNARAEEEDKQKTYLIF